MECSTKEKYIPPIGPISSFGAIDGFLVYVLGTDGKLWREWGDWSNRVSVDDNVLWFWAIDSNFVYVQGGDNQLWRERDNKSNRDFVDDNVLAFQPIDETVVYVLGVEQLFYGNLWRELGNKWNRSLVDTNVGQKYGEGNGGNGGG